MVHKKAAAYRWRFVSRFVKKNQKPFGEEDGSRKPKTFRKETNNQTSSVCGGIFMNQRGEKLFSASFTFRSEF
jgi:hypothetical protein